MINLIKRCKTLKNSFTALVLFCLFVCFFVFSDPEHMKLAVPVCLQWFHLLIEIVITMFTILEM